jgi:hypothetical protein
LNTLTDDVGVVGLAAGLEKLIHLPTNSNIRSALWGKILLTKNDPRLFVGPF